MIFKPLDGMGGTGYFPGQARTTRNISVILEMLTGHGSQTIMAQRYIPEISPGRQAHPDDTTARRYPTAWRGSREVGETRGNLAAGGSGRPQPLTERDQWIAAQVGPSLREKGLLFVGLDIIGDYLTEINVTSPTCIREIDGGLRPGHWRAVDGLHFATTGSKVLTVAVARG